MTMFQFHASGICTRQPRLADLRSFVGQVCSIAWGTPPTHWGSHEPLGRFGREDIPESDVHFEDRTRRLTGSWFWPDSHCGPFTTLTLTIEREGRSFADAVGQLALTIEACFLTGVPNSSLEEARHFCGCEVGKKGAVHYFMPLRLYGVGIPNLGCISVFSGFYLKHFGRERLLSAPAEVAEEIAPGYILLQIVKDLEQMKQDWAGFHQKRLAVMEHLGLESFPRRRRPDDPPPRYEQEESTVAAPSIPQELVPCREYFEKWYLRNTGPKDVPAITDPAEVLLDTGRFEVAEICRGKKMSRAIVDTARQEFVEIADVKVADDLAAKLMAAGAEVRKYKFAATGNIR